MEKMRDNSYEYQEGFFLNKGRERRKLFKSFPFIPLALEAIRVSLGEKVLIINSSGGILGKALAEAYPKTSFFLYYDSLETENAVRATINREDQPSNIDIFPLDKQYKVDVLVLETGGFISPLTFRYLLRRYLEFLREAGEVYVVTHKNWGLTRKIKILEKILGEVEIAARGRGGYRIIKGKKRGEKEIEKISEETPLVKFSLFGKDFLMETRPGLFSWENLDEGTKILLAAAREEIEKARLILDVGCGWGVIGIVAAVLNSNAQVAMVDVSKIAIEAATANIRRFDLASRVKVFGGIENLSECEFDLVLSNPPLHCPREEVLGLFGSVKRRMVKKGKLFLVVQEGHKEIYEETLKRLFNAVTSSDRIITPKGNYFILRAKK